MCRRFVVFLLLVLPLITLVISDDYKVYEYEEDSKETRKVVKSGGGGGGGSWKSESSGGGGGGGSWRSESSGGGREDSWTYESSSGGRGGGGGGGGRWRSGSSGGGGGGGGGGGRWRSESSGGEDDQWKERRVITKEYRSEGSDGEWGGDGGSRSKIEYRGRGGGGSGGEWGGDGGSRSKTEYRGGGGGGSEGEWGGDGGSRSKTVYRGGGGGGGGGSEGEWGDGGSGGEWGGDGGSRTVKTKYFVEKDVEVDEESYGNNPWEAARCVCGKNKTPKIDLKCLKILLGLDCDESGEGKEGGGTDIIKQATDTVKGLLGGKGDGGGGAGDGILGGLGFGRRKRGLGFVGDIAKKLEYTKKWIEVILKCWTGLGVCWCGNGGPKNAMQNCGMDAKEIVGNGVPMCAWDIMCRVPPKCCCEYDKCVYNIFGEIWTKFKQCNKKSCS